MYIHHIYTIHTPKHTSKHTYKHPIYALNPPSLHGIGTFSQLCKYNLACLHDLLKDPANRQAFLAQGGAAILAKVLSAHKDDPGITDAVKHCGKNRLF